MAKLYLLLTSLTASTPIFALQPRLTTHPLFDIRPKSSGAGRLSDSRANATLHVARGLDGLDGLSLFPRQAACSSGYCKLGLPLE